MKKLVLLLVVLSVFSGGIVWAAADELKIFIWSEYMDEENMPKDFEKATGIPVRLDLYESNEEMMAKLQAGGVSQYDIIVPSDYIMPSLINLGLIQPLDHSKIPNLKNLGTKFKETTFDPGNKYSAGWQWGTVGLMYRKDRIKAADAKSWSIIFDPKKDPGPFALIDSVREMMGITLLYLGYDFNSINPKELKAAADLLIETKKRQSCLGFKGGVSAARTMWWPERPMPPLSTTGTPFRPLPKIRKTWGLWCRRKAAKFGSIPCAYRPRPPTRKRHTNGSTGFWIPRSMPR